MLTVTTKSFMYFVLAFLEPVQFHTKQIRQFFDKKTMCRTLTLPMNNAMFYIITHLYQ